MKIAITGSTGLVGSRIVELLKNDIEFIAFTQDTLDITNQEQVESTLLNQHYDLFLHLAAYTHVDRAEAEKKQAYALNVAGTTNLFNITKQKGKPFIYFSTDFVFNGASPPYSEESAPQPIGYYGQSKFEGEQAVKDGGTIVRISYPYGNSPSQKPDFVQRIKTLLEQGKQLHMISDSSMTPTYIDDIAGALKYIVQSPLPGIYHLVGTQSVSPYESGQMIAKHYGLSLDLVRPTTYEDYMKGKALRPRYSQMISKKNTFYPMKSFEEGLKCKV